MKKLTALRPLWEHDSSGEKTGISFNCPRCRPAGSCIVSIKLKTPLPGEDFSNLETFTSLIPVTGTCDFFFFVTKGQVHFE
jgi:hypothetical protein